MYVKCNSTRIKQFQLKTIIYEENGEKFVKKEALCEEAIPHLLQMKKNYEKLKKTIVDSRIHFAKIIAETENSLTFEFIAGVSMEERFLQAKQHNPKKAEQIILEYISLVRNGFKITTFVQRKMEKSYTGIFGEGDYTQLEGKYCFDTVSNCDLIPSNILYKENKVYIIDYEWVFDLSIPIEYVYFRGLKLLQDSILLQKHIDSKIIEELFRHEDHFILQYILTKDSFYQIQHDYLKNRLSILEELRVKDQALLDRDKEIDYLKKLAQAMRIKNRIKKWFPKNIFLFYTNYLQGNKK